ncbi:Ankyrin repeat domain-containing protein 1 [Hondaea fermentalgiana]|uniref:Ankyrin repeat domain-containing protein 1 n=1 Tax=Hondaea fermentalgiana TaxID=2315210 RepID=A0A2R5GNF5_9STRA|nr:Ankyrin repeat domain-containing protein 1 [Hondaea fermentalgiana]|eukprot:GBG32427.1 Ankyrin repeat domain-containing protein 1 [Hondaea fermentalgiana]
MALEKLERLGKIFVLVQPQLKKLDKALITNVLSRDAALETLTGGTIDFASEEEKTDFLDALESNGMGGVDTEALIQLPDDLGAVTAQSASDIPPEAREEALQRVLVRLLLAVLLPNPERRPQETEKVLVKSFVSEQRRACGQADPAAQPSMRDLNHELRSFKEALGKSLKDLVALHEAIHVPESCFDIMYMRASGNASDDSMETKLLRAARRADFETCKRILQTDPEVDPLGARGPPTEEELRVFQRNAADTESDPDQLQGTPRSSLDYLIAAIARIRTGRNAFGLTENSRNEEVSRRFKAAKLQELQSARDVVALMLERGTDAGKLSHIFARALRSFDVKTLQTPLHLAIEMKSPEMVAVLCENGAESDDKALLATVDLGHVEILQILEKVGNASPNQYRGELNRTLLHLACNKPDAGDDDFVQMLIQMNGAVNEVDMIGRTALHNAAAMGNLSAVRSLLEAGANETLPTRREGSTVIHEAAKMGRISVLQFVLRNASGETVDAVDMQGRTPLCYAFKRHSEENEEVVSTGLENIESSDGLKNFIAMLKQRVVSAEALRGIGRTREMSELVNLIRKRFPPANHYQLSTEDLQSIEVAQEMKAFVELIKNRYRELDALSPNFKVVDSSKLVRDLHVLPLMRQLVCLISLSRGMPSRRDRLLSEENLIYIESSYELREFAVLIHRRIGLADSSCTTANEVRVFKFNLVLASGSAFCTESNNDSMPNLDGEILSFFPQDICQNLERLSGGSEKNEKEQKEQKEQKELQDILRNCFEELFVEIRKTDAVLGILLDAGADIDHVDDQGNPAFDDDYRIEYFKTREEELRAALEKRSKLAHDQPIFKGKIVHHAVHAMWVQQGFRCIACCALVYWVILLALLTLVAIRYSGCDVYESFSVQASVVNRMSSGDAGTLEDVKDLDSWNDYVENVFVEAIWPSESDLHVDADNWRFGQGLVLLGRPRYPYWSDPFNYVDLSIMILFLWLVVTHIELVHGAAQRSSDWLENSERDVFIDVSDLMWLSTVRQYLLGGVVFFCYLKTLEYLRVAATFAVPVMIIIGMLAKLMSFLTILAVFVLAFGIFDYVVFGLKYAPVNSVMKALVFTLRGALGELDFDGKYEMDQVVGTGMTMLAAVLLVILLLNLLIAVMKHASEKTGGRNSILRALNTLSLLNYASLVRQDAQCRITLSLPGFLELALNDKDVHVRHKAIEVVVVVFFSWPGVLRQFKRYEADDVFLRALSLCAYVTSASYLLIDELNDQNERFEQGK